jgi:hypothetical protein
VYDMDSESNNTPVGDNQNPSGTETAGNEGKSFARIPDGTGNWVDPIPTPGGPNRLEETVVVKSDVFSPLSSVALNLGPLEPNPLVLVTETFETVETAETSETVEIVETAETAETETKSESIVESVSTTDPEPIIDPEPITNPEIITTEEQPAAITEETQSIEKVQVQEEPKQETIQTE